MVERNVTDDQILHVLAAHEFAAPGNSSGTLLSRRFPDGRELKVWISGGLPIGYRVIIKSVAWRD